MLKNILLALFGLAIFPIVFIVQRIILRLPSVPGVFWDLATHFEKHGIKGNLLMQKVQVNGVEKLAYLALSEKVGNFKVLTLALCPSPEIAVTVESEITGAQQYSHQARNERIILGCTFIPPDEVLGQRIRDVFLQFNPR